jgi:hypothetical protein
MDSTSRLIHLLITSGEPVQPHYIIRHEESTGHEIDTMNKLRRAISGKYPEKRENLLPTIYTNEDHIPRSEEIASEIDKLKMKVKVHEQLRILADYCKMTGIHSIEITYERDEKLVPGILHVSDFFDTISAFDSFINPYKDMTKRAIYALAVSEGWDDLLKMTTFCRRPRRMGRPCGTCGPCCEAVKEGMGFRLPFIPRMKATVLLPLRMYYRKNYDKHDVSWFFKIVKHQFENRL